MTETTETKNKALVLEAFDTLFNNGTTSRPRGFGRRTTSSIARIFRRGVRVYSV